MKLTKYLSHVLTIKHTLDDGNYTYKLFSQIVSQIVIIKKIAIIIATIEKDSDYY